MVQDMELAYYEPQTLLSPFSNAKEGSKTDQFQNPRVFRNEPDSSILIQQNLHKPAHVLGQAILLPLPAPVVA